MADEFLKYAALCTFVAAVLHTFGAGYFRKKSARLPAGVSKQILSYFGEVEAVFGLWAVVLFGVYTYLLGFAAAVEYFDHKVSYIEPMFVFVIMAQASMRPVLLFAESVIKMFAALGRCSVAAWWFSILTIGPILGSFITEPAAMTICALLLAQYFYQFEPSNRFAYATLGLLFVNVSVGGVCTHFAAPPVLMVARAWSWDTLFMFSHFGWKALIGILIANTIYWLLFHREFAALAKVSKQTKGTKKTVAKNLSVPVWVMITHLLFMVWTIVNAHHPALFVGAFIILLGFYFATQEYQTKLDLKNPLLVGFFLAGLVIHGGLQSWWLAPLLTGLTEVPLMLVATALTSVNDNAAITYLSTFVPNFSDSLKYAVVAGAVTGGGLTVIANAPNPAGQALLDKYFSDKQISPLYLAAGALLPTVIMGLCFMFL